MLDVGDPIPDLGVTTTNDGTGALADPTTLTLTLTLPDGTAKVGTHPAAPGDTLTVARASTGIYATTYLTVQAGRHTARWVAVGNGTDGAHVDAWEAGGTDDTGIVSLAEAREHLRISASDTDEQIRHFVAVASDLCEARTRNWRRRTVTATLDGGRETLDLERPVLSVTTVLEDGTAVPSTDWLLYPSQGLLVRGTSTTRDVWAPGRRNVVVTYVTGSVDVPTPVRHGVLLLVQHLLDSRRTGAGIGRGSTDFAYPAGFTVPNAVREAWGPWSRRKVG